jgi:uncharacterized protein (TIGR02145 family)
LIRTLRKNAICEIQNLLVFFFKQSKTSLIFMFIRKIFSLVFNTAIILLSHCVQAQNIGIGTTTPHPSAALEISNNSKGVLVPRMSFLERNQISNPAAGLLVYVTDSLPGFWYHNGTAWMSLVSILPFPGDGKEGQTLKICNGSPTWTTNGICPGLLEELKCSEAVHSGLIIQGVSVNDASCIIPYTGRYYGPYNSQISPSFGITGLYANVAAGNINVFGTQQLNVSFYGTPTASGLAFFPIEIGGKTCVLSREVLTQGTIATIDCNNTINSGTLTRLLPADNVSSSVPYTDGNGGAYYGQENILSTGVTGLRASFSSGSFANGPGNLLVTITGIPESSGTASFAFNIAGKACTLNRAVVRPQAEVSSLDCKGTDVGILQLGVTYFSGVNTTINYTGGNGGTYSAQNFPSSGVTGLTAKLTAGTLADGAGSLSFNITGTPQGTGAASFTINFGGSTCTIYRTVYGTGTTGITAHTCGAVNVHNTSIPYGTMTDQQGNSYKTVLIGNQTWMAENLRTSIFRNSSPIQNIISVGTWQSTTTAAYCNYGNNISFDCPYGKLYNWYAASSINLLCPTGWHVPTLSDINILTEFISLSKAQNTGTQYWISGGGVNSSGLSILPGGKRLPIFESTYPDGFYGIGLIAEFWSSSTFNADSGYQISENFISGSANKKGGKGVRCVKD